MSMHPDDVESYIQEKGEEVVMVIIKRMILLPDMIYYLWTIINM